MRDNTFSMENIIYKHAYDNSCRASNILGAIQYSVKIQVDVHNKLCEHIHSSLHTKRISGGDPVGSIAYWPWQVNSTCMYTETCL